VSQEQTVELECAGTIAWEDIYRIEYRAEVGVPGA
jgi:hypothetical protein